MLVFAYFVAFVVIIILAAICCLVHETGHGFVAWLLGVRVKAMGLCWRGGYIRREQSENINHEILITLAGPMANLLTGLALWHFCSFFPIFNIVLGLVNLLPITNSDGLRIWQLLQLRR